jgi:streptogrisin C
VGRSETPNQERPHAHPASPRRDTGPDHRARGRCPRRPGRRARRHPGRSTALPPYLADANDPAVTTLAKDRGISIHEAQRRIGWQGPAAQLGDELRQALGDRFGGLWLDEADGGRVKIGVVGGDATGARALIERFQLTAVSDLVPVRHSYASLEAANASLGTVIARANQGTAVGLGSALLVDSNQVELSLPRGQRLNAAQQAVVDQAKRRLGAALRLGWWQGQVRKDACAFAGGSFDCDPPLRGGTSLYNFAGGVVTTCSSAFYAKSTSDGKPYVMTAGHCGAGGTNWSAFQPRDGAFHSVGTMHHSRDAGNDDYGIITINNPSGWDPKPWVYVHASEDTTENCCYLIKGHATSPKDTRVCLSGAVTGTSCGKVEKVGVGATTDDPSGLAQVDLCAQPGDSGGAIYSGNLARGILVGQVRGAPFCNDALFQGVAEAEDELNVAVVRAP